MRIIEPSQFSHNKQAASKKRVKVWLSIFLVILIIVPSVYIVSVLLLPLPAIAVTTEQLQFTTGQPVDVAWPSYGQAAIGTQDYGVLASKNAGKSVPIASIAKVIAIMTVLKQKPLVRGEKGPDIVVTPVDIQTYQDYIAKDGVVLPVQLGESLTQYQVMQAMLLPSANNAADMLARWAFGSLDAYTVRANAYVESLGMHHTTVSDASGFSPATKSTAQDLVILAAEALKNPVVKEIMSQKQASLPIAGTIHNTNYLLGKNGNIGMKTGTTDEAGGCFLFASVQKVDGGQSVTVVGAILGAPLTIQAIQDSAPLARSAAKGFTNITPIKAGQVAASYEVPWQTPAKAVATEDVTLLAWNGTPVQLTSSPEIPDVPAASGANAGDVRILTRGSETTAQLKLDSPIRTPSLLWRMKQAWPLNQFAN